MLARGRLGEPHGQEAGGGDERAGEHGKGGGGPGEARGPHAVPALFHLHHHHLDGDDGVVHQQAEGDDERAQRDAVQVHALREHDQEDDGQNQRHREGDHDAGAEAEGEEAHHQNDDQRLGEGLQELAHRFPDNVGLVGHLRHIDPGRKLRDGGVHGRLQVSAEGDDVRARRHGDADAEGIAAQVRHAGAIFIGPHTPEAIGDYVGGSNHVLPTARSARFSSGLGVLDFMKRTSILKCTPEALAVLGPPAVRLSRVERLDAHGRSILVRSNAGG
ncbi:MAG: hypothetical protein B7X76_08380 [Azorhizobium sp. 39-67-5]|nr:MAG: hypothetical protein B7X76_08380 [Azorhizobium sp. 39-67-5]